MQKVSSLAGIVPADSREVPLASRYSRIITQRYKVFAYGAITLYGRTFQSLLANLKTFLLCIEELEKVEKIVELPQDSKRNYLTTPKKFVYQFPLENKRFLITNL